MTAITQALTSALLHFVWQGLIVAGLLWLTLFVLRKHSANTRYAITCAALMILAALPIITMYLVYESPGAVRESAGVAAPVRSISTFLKSEIPIPTSEIPASWFAWAQSWTLTVWSFGVILFSMRILWAGKHVYKLKRRGESADRPVLDMVERLAERIGVDRQVRVLISSIADGPSVVGWLRPVVLIPPAAVLGLTPEQLEAVIAHELAHIRRHDYFVSALQAVVETLLFYHPAVWWTSARIRHERELCCDDLAVRSCGDPISYARALTKLEKIRVMKPSMVLASTDGPLVYRVQRLVGLRTQEYGPSRWSGAVVLILGLAGLTLNMNWVRAESPQSQERKTAPEVHDQAGVTVNLGGSAIVHRSELEYPKSAIAKGVQGTVSVEATLDSTGNVVDARVLTGPQELRKAALQSVLQWHFVSDTAQATRVVHINFDLAAARESKEEGGAFAGFVVKSPYAEAEIRKKIAEAEVIEPGTRRAYNVVTENETRKAEEATARRLKELEEALVGGTTVTLGDNVKAKIERDKMREEAAIVRYLPFTAVDRVLKGVRVFGLSDQVTQQLVSSLPVREGETLTKASIEAITAAIRRFDEHLEHRFLATEDNGVELRIVAPGSGREIEFEPLRRKP